jgi:tetratricopeptide (TPR) repeat protein
LEEGFTVAGDDKDAKIEKARQLAESGKFVSAISAWRQLLDETPHNDANVYNTIGDLCLKNKATADAIDAYSKAARFYLQEGFHLKAVALYKKILKLDPNRAEVYTLLGDLNVVRGLMSNAVADYLSGAKTYLKTGKAMNALTLFRKITKVDPQNTDMRLRVAELCLKENLTEEAIEEYLRIGHEYQRLSRAEEAGKLYEQVLKISPDHPEARRRLDHLLEPVAAAPEPAASAAEELTVADAVQSAVALETPTAPEPAPQPASAAGVSPPTLDEVRRLLAAGEVGEAERMIRTLLLEDPDRNEYQAVLGMIYLKKGHASIAHDILHPMAKSWLQEGRREEAVEIVEAFLAVESGDAEFLALKAEVSGVPAGAPAVAAAVPPDGLGGSIEFDAAGFSFEPLAPSPAQAAPPSEVETPVREAEPVAPDLDVVAPDPPVLAAAIPVEVTASPAATGSSQAVGAEFEAIFEQLRTGSNDQAGDEEFETHYDLGVAYKEMGLIAEAIEEFQWAARGQTRFVDACAMIAACYKDQNLHTSAITFLERVLADTRCVGPGVPYVKYDLAVLYEDEGFADKAVRLYEDIPSIRDVEARLRRVQGNEEPMARPPAGTRRPVSYL